MRHKAIISLLLACGIFLKEIHTFFSNAYHPGKFPLDPAYVTSDAWHVNFITSRLFAGIGFFGWYYREIQAPYYDRQFARLLLMVCVYLVLDFIAYMLFHAMPGYKYFLLVFIPILIYAGNYSYKSIKNRT